MSVRALERFTRALERSKQSLKETPSGLKHDLRAKGVKKSVAKTDLSHSDYQDVVSQRVNTKDISQRGFRTFKHEIYTIEMKKVGLSAFDDKRFVLDGGIQTLAWGHKDIKQEDISFY